MASLFVTLRLTGHVSNGEAREFIARLTDLAESCEAVGVEVKQSVDVRLDPEQSVDPVQVVEPEPGLEPVAVVADDVPAEDPE